MDGDNRFELHRNGNRFAQLDEVDLSDFPLVTAASGTSSPSLAKPTKVKGKPEPPTKAPRPKKTRHSRRPYELPESEDESEEPATAPPPPPPPKKKYDFDVNSYAAKKTAANGMINLGLLVANSTQLRTVVLTGGGHRFYGLLLGLLGLSLTLQLAVGLVLVFLSHARIHTEEMTKSRYKKNQLTEVVNDLTVAAVLIITFLNIFISAFFLADYPTAAGATANGSQPLTEP